MRFLIPLLAAVFVGCSPLLENIEPEPDRKELGQQSSTAVVAPLLWHANDDWRIDPLFGVAERASACGGPEPDLHSLSIEIDPATVPNGATVFGASLVIDPCDVRGSWLPDNLPVFALFAVDRFGGAVQTASAAQDQSQDATSYSIPHEIVMTMDPAPVQVNREKNRYMILFEPEYAIDATGGTRVLGLSFNVALP